MRVVLASVVLLAIFNGHECLPDKRFISPEHMYDCYFKLLCKINALEEFQERIKVAELWIQTWVFRNIKKLYSIEVSENNMADWNLYRNTVCNYTEPRKRETFNEFFTRGGEKWMRVCQNPDTKQCKEMSFAAGKVFELIESHVKAGDCNMPGVAQQIKGFVTSVKGRFG